jgi:hypothetical protein
LQILKENMSDFLNEKFFNFVEKVSSFYVSFREQEINFDLFSIADGCKIQTK